MSRKTKPNQSTHSQIYAQVHTQNPRDRMRKYARSLLSAFTCGTLSIDIKCGQNKCQYFAKMFECFSHPLSLCVYVYLNLELDYNAWLMIADKEHHFTFTIFPSTKCFTLKHYAMASQPLFYHINNIAFDLMLSSQKSNRILYSNQFPSNINLQNGDLSDWKKKNERTNKRTKTPKRINEPTHGILNSFQQKKEGKKSLSPKHKTIWIQNMINYCTLKMFCSICELLKTVFNSPWERDSHVKSLWLNQLVQLCLTHQNNTKKTSIFFLGLAFFLSHFRLPL